MLLVQGPHFENHWSKQVTAGGKGAQEGFVEVKLCRSEDSARGEAMCGGEQVCGWHVGDHAGRSPGPEVLGCKTRCEVWGLLGGS